MTRRGTFALLASLYVSQFLGVGFFFTALVAILRDRGVPLEQLAVIQALGLVWAVKFLWTPLIDRYGRRYRSWLLVLQPLIAVAPLATIPLDPVADFGSLILLAALVVLVSATQDIAADALAVRVLDFGYVTVVAGAAALIIVALGLASRFFVGVDQAVPAPVEV